MLDDLDLFFGATSENDSQVYARLNVLAKQADLELGGSIRGPFCEHTRTLPTTAPFADLGPGTSLAATSLLANAQVTDPCFWSPQLPALYQVHVELRQHGKVIETEDRQLGIRSFGVRQDSLYLNGQRWVPRGVMRGSVVDEPLAAWIEASTVMVAEQAEEEVCRQASNQGVFMIVVLRSSGDQLVKEVKRLARWAAVGLVVLDGSAEIGPLRSAAPNLVFGRIVDDGMPVPRSPDDVTDCDVTDCDVIVARSDSVEEIGGRLSTAGLPVVAFRPGNSTGRLSERRAACDRLQRDLAQYGPFAGYLV